MSELLGWLIRKIGVTAIVAMLLLVVALGSIVLGLRTVVRNLDVELMILVGIAALVVGWALAKSPFPARLAFVCATMVGVEFITIRVGHLGAKIVELGQSLGVFAWRLLNWRTLGIPDPNPVLNILDQLWNALLTLAIRLRDWLVAVLGGVPAFDPVATAFAWSALIWCVAVWAAWSTRRRERAFEAMLPGIVLLAAAFAFAGADASMLVVLIAVTLLLMALISARARERHWVSNSIDMAEDIRQDIAFVAISITTTLVAIAALVPSLSIRDVVEFSQNAMREHVSEVNRIPDSLGIIPQPAPTTGFEVLRAPGMPRSHLIGASPELLQSVVMFIRTDDLNPGMTTPPRYYWRGNTYDRYTGRGWVTSDTQVVRLKEGDAATTMPIVHRIVRQEVQTKNTASVLYVAGTFVSADADVRIAQRSPDDIFGAQIQARNYRADSFVVTPTEEQLRAASTAYPDWIVNRYLDLPNDVPPRVLGLARDLTATARTPYDRARAIENYLREFPYTLDLAPPPSNRDVVDYFLFDLKKGYCDYYATAMVVLARAAGLPARLVVGYATGIFDPDNARFTVREADAHAWVEIYFSEYGWVEFEPTSARAPINRAAEAEIREPLIGRTPITTSTELPAIDSRAWVIVFVGIVVLSILAIVSAFAFDEWRLNQLAPQRAIGVVYIRLLDSARRLGVTSQPSETPNEIVARLMQRLDDVRRQDVYRSLQNRRGLRVGDPARATMLDQASRQAQMLTDLYVRSRYSAHNPGNVSKKQALETWRQLRARLWRVWWWRATRR